MFAQNHKYFATLFTCFKFSLLLKKVKVGSPRRLTSNNVRHSVPLFCKSFLDSKPATKLLKQHVILQIIALTERGVALLTCTGFFHQFVLFCASLDHSFERRNNCTAHTWKACLLNVCTCVLLGYQPVDRSSHTVCSWRASLPNVLACASWGYQQLWRSSYTGCN